MNRTRKIAYGGIAAALTSAMLVLTGNLPMGGYVCAVLAGIVNLCFSCKIGRLYTWLSFAASGIIACLLCTDRSGVLLYLLLTGYYPMLRTAIQGHWFRVVLKALTAVGSGSIYLFLCVGILGMAEALLQQYGQMIPAVLMIGYGLAFIAFDYMLGQFEKRYLGEVIRMMDRLMK